MAKRHNPPIEMQLEVMRQRIDALEIRYLEQQVRTFADILTTAAMLLRDLRRTGETATR